MKRHLVVLTGAGMSAESGLKTFRDSGGLWEGYAVADVATPDAWERDQALVLKFYNERRKALLSAQPNPGHKALVALEEHYRVTVITQNVDDLHERAGSSNVIHLHGQLRQARSTKNPHLVYEIQGSEIRLGDVCELGSQLRPNIVWFGEEVPMMDRAISIAREADLFAVVGTSLVVYPAAGLVDYVGPQVPKYLVDLSVPAQISHQSFTVIQKPASQGVPELSRLLLQASPRATTTIISPTAAGAAGK